MLKESAQPSNKNIASDSKTSSPAMTLSLVKAAVPARRLLKDYNHYSNIKKSQPIQRELAICNNKFSTLVQE